MNNFVRFYKTNKVSNRFEKNYSFLTEWMFFELIFQNNIFPMEQKIFWFFFWKGYLFLLYWTNNFGKLTFSFSQWFYWKIVWWKINKINEKVTILLCLISVAKTQLVNTVFELSFIWLLP